MNPAAIVNSHSDEYEFSTTFQGYRVIVIIWYSSLISKPFLFQERSHHKLSDLSRHSKQEHETDSAHAP